MYKHTKRVLRDCDGSDYLPSKHKTSHFLRRFSLIRTFIRHTVTDSLLYSNGAVHYTAITGLYIVVVLMMLDSRP